METANYRTKRKIPFTHAIPSNRILVLALFLFLIAALIVFVDSFTRIRSNVTSAECQHYFCFSCLSVFGGLERGKKLEYFRID